MSTFLSGTAVGNWTTETELMRHDEVRTVFSVYRIWQQEAQGPIAADRREVADAMKIVERRITPLAPAKHRQHCRDLLSSHIPKLDETLKGSVRRTADK